MFELSLVPLFFYSERLTTACISSAMFGVYSNNNIYAILLLLLFYNVILCYM